MRSLFRFIFQYLMVLALLFLCLAAWICYDGLHDLGDKADAALVIHPSDDLTGLKNASEHAGLDRAIQLYNNSDISYIIVVGSTSGPRDEANTMAQYLAAHQVPPDAVIEDLQGQDLDWMARDVAEVMKARQSHSVMIIADYYAITPAKLALVHQNVVEIGKIHLGILQAQDAVPIGLAAVDLCKFVGKVFLLPAAEKAREEAQVGLKKATADAAEVKKNVDTRLNSMSK